MLRPYLINLSSGFALGSFCSGLVSDRFGRKRAIWASSVTMLIFGVITSFVPWYINQSSFVTFNVISRFPLFVFTWWVTGTMAIACYTAAFVWTMEIAAGKWKIYIGMSMNYSWPICRLIIAGYIVPHIFSDIFMNSYQGWHMDYEIGIGTLELFLQW